MSDLGFWGGLLSGVGRGLETWQALRQAEDDRRQREWEREQQLINQRLDLARASMANAERQGFVLSPEAQRNWQKALLAPDEPTGGDLASIGNADAPLRQAVPAVHQSLAAEEGRVAGEPINRALQLASMLPTGSNPRANGSGLTAWYQNMTPRGVTGDVHDLGGGVSLVDPNFAGPATAEIQGEYGLRKQAAGDQTRKDVAMIMTDPQRDIRRREFAPRSAGTGSEEPKTPQLQAAAYAVRAGIAGRTMSHIERTNFNAVLEAARAVNTPAFARLIPFIGSRTPDAARALREVGLSDAAQEYLNSLFEFAQNAAPGQFTPGAIRSPQLLFQIWSEYGAQPGENPRGVAIKRRNRANYILQGRLRAGPAAWQRALGDFKVHEGDILDENPLETQEIMLPGLTPDTSATAPGAKRHLPGNPFVTTP